jgi:hypothetical protein
MYTFAAWKATGEHDALMFGPVALNGVLTLRSGDINIEAASKMPG